MLRPHLHPLQRPRRLLPVLLRLGLLLPLPLQLLLLVLLPLLLLRHLAQLLWLSCRLRHRAQLRLLLLLLPLLPLQLLLALLLLLLLLLLPLLLLLRLAQLLQLSCWLPRRRLLLLLLQLLPLRLLLLVLLLPSCRQLVLPPLGRPVLQLLLRILLRFPPPSQRRGLQQCWPGLLLRRQEPCRRWHLGRSGRVPAQLRAQLRAWPGLPGHAGGGH